MEEFNLFFQKPLNILSKTIKRDIFQITTSYYDIW